MNNNKFKFSPKLLVFTILILFSLGAAWAYISKYSNRSKAGTQNVNFTFSPSSGTFSVGAEQTMDVVIASNDNTNKLSGIDLTINSDGVAKLVKVSGPVPLAGGDPAMFAQIINDVSDQKAHIAYTATVTDDKLPSSVKFSIVFKSASAGSGNISVDAASSLVTGNISGNQYGLNPLSANSFTFTGISSSITPSPTTSPTGSVTVTPSPTGTAISCLSFPQTDDFEATSLNTSFWDLWTGSGANGTAVVDQSGGVLNTSLTRNPALTVVPSEGWAGVNTHNKVCGDFDVSVDFGGFTSDGKSEADARLSVEAAGSDNKTTVFIERSASTFNGILNPGMIQTSMVVNGVEQVGPNATNINATSGKLRIRRIGNKIWTYYYTGSGSPNVNDPWINLGVFASGFATDVQPAFIVKSFDQFPSVSANFDNFYATVGIPDPSSTPIPTVTPVPSATLTPTPPSGIDRYTIDIGDKQSLLINLSASVNPQIRFKAALGSLRNFPDMYLRLRVRDELAFASNTTTPADACINPQSGDLDFYIPVHATNNIYAPVQQISLPAPTVPGATVASVTPDGWVILNGIIPGRYYSFYLKGPKTRKSRMVQHVLLQPNQISTQDYDWNSNSLDPGDLPDPDNGMKQDCVVSSKDWSLLMARIGASGQADQPKLDVCDVDYDGQCSAGDSVAILHTLDKHPDDDQ